MASSEMGQIQDFLLVFKRRIWQVIIPALFVLAGGIFFAVIVPKKYVVTTKIELLQTAGHQAISEETATLREIINAENHIQNSYRVEEVIRQQNWDEYARLDGDDRHDFVQSVVEDLSVTLLTPDRKGQTSSAFVEIEYADTDGKRAERFLNALTDRWIDDVVQRDRNQLLLEREEYQNEVEATQKAFNEATTQKLDLIREMGISVTQSVTLKSERDEDPVFAQLSTAQQELDEVTVDLEEVRAKIATRRAEYEALPPEIPVEEVEAGVQFQEQILALETKIAEARQLQTGKTQEHSIYKKAQLEIEAMEEQIETTKALERESTKRTAYQRNPVREALGQELSALELAERGLGAKLEGWKKEVKDKSALHQAQVANWTNLLNLEKAWEHAGIAFDEARARLRQAEARLNAYAAVEGEPYRIAEAPRAPLKPSKPNPAVIVVASLLGGIALGLAVAFLAEYSKSCFRSVGDLSRVMGVPILGVINTIETRADIRRRRSKQVVIGGSTAAILASVAWFTYAWAYDQARLPIFLQQAVEDLRLSLR